MFRSLKYGDQVISYSVAQDHLLASKIRIHVHPSGAVEVEAPVGCSDGEVATAVRKRARWIVRQLENVAAARTHARPRQYKSGETHFYLGRRYQLKVIESQVEAPSVLMKGGQIRVVLKCADPASVRRHLNDWYRQKAEDYFARRLAEISAEISWVKQTPVLKLVSMRKQWGSCSPKGGINLNPWLVRAPRDCIDYVIRHEICHLREHNHSKRYYNLLERQLPDWRSVKTRLDDLAELLLAA